MTLDINNQEAFLDNAKLDLNPSEEEIRQDIDELLSIDPFLAEKTPIRP